MRLIVFVLLILGFLSPLPIIAQTCDDFTSRFAMGMSGKVTPGSANNHPRRELLDLCCTPVTRTNAGYVL